uniref:Kinesin-like protein KIF14 n=1 Tax=Oryzias sinensis TaxID=183150 RepID=A0A8C7ZVA4_9TELE
MSLFSVQTRKHTAYYDHLLSASTPRTSLGRERQGQGEQKATDPSLSENSSSESVCADRRKSSEKSRQATRPYVTHALSKSGSSQLTPNRGRLTLQRRSRRKSRTETAEKTMLESSKNSSTPAPEKRLTLQRRTTRTPSMDKTRVSVRQPTPKALSDSNGRTPVLFRSTSLKETDSKSNKLAETSSLSSVRSKTSFNSTASEDQSQIFKTPNRKTPFSKIAAKRDVFERLACKEVPKVVAVKSASLEMPKPRAQQQAEFTKPDPRVCKISGGHLKSCSVAQEKKTSISERKGDVKRTSTAATEQLTHPTEQLTHPTDAVRQQESFKMENSAVTVAVRIRPFNPREKAEKALQVIFTSGQDTLVQHPHSKQSFSFTYDFSFCSVDDSNPAFASQQTVYETLAKPLLLRAFEGFNTCLFAYGQTGSGKSYTMMGFEGEAGVTPRFCQDLFSKLASLENVESFHFICFYFEVYNEKIHDLLVTRDEPTQRRMPLRVREHPVHGPYVADLSGWLELGNKQRATAATGMNDKSSRSHSVFTLVMTQTKTESVEGEEHDHSITSRINLVDLAGSERCNSAQTSGDRLREGASINKSLLTLGKVISALSEQMLTRKKVFIPYRESVLTWLLKESLGGNSKTAMIATLSPAGSNVEESLSTLRYAQQARTIINVAKVNEDTSAKLIRELKAEVEKLRAAQTSSKGVEPERARLFQQEIATLKNKLCQQEREMAEANRAWRKKFEEAETRKREETKELQKAGVTFKVDNRLPNLVNLNEDPQLSEMLLYMIKEGQTTVGKLRPDSSHDIQLTGTLIADQHCIISNIQNTVSITPMKNAKTFVNGNLITESTVLHHGDRVILGGDHYFRFNHPAEVQSGKRVSCWTDAGDGHKDFEFAKNELLAAQRAKLEAEIEEAHLKAKEEMIQGIQMAKEVAQKELFNQKALYEERIQALEKESTKANIICDKCWVERLLMAPFCAAAPPPWDSMKLSLMIEEANKISAKLKKHTVFSSLHVRVQNTKLGISTFWSLDKFQNNMAAMRELEQGDSTSKDDNVFYDPDDEWEQDISTSSASTSSFSRRRSRSLLKSKRISGRLYEIRVHPIQSLHTSSCQTAGMPLTQIKGNTAIPGICKELIGQSVSRLRHSSGTEESLADRLISDLSLIYKTVQTISDLYNGLDDDSQDNVCQLLLWLVYIDSLSNQAQFSTFFYSNSTRFNPPPPLSGQGCESEITSMVVEAQRKSSKCMDAALLALGQFAVVTGMPMSITRLDARATDKVIPPTTQQQWQLLSLFTPVLLKVWGVPPMRCQEGAQ